MTDPVTYVDAAARSTNPFSAAVAADPVPFYRELRATAPIALLMEMPGTHVISRYEDVKFALQHTEIFSSELAAVDLGQRRPLIPLQIDPPEHVKYRRVIDPHLSPRQMNPHEDRIRSLVNELIDGFVADGGVDFHGRFSVPLPCTVFMEMCGLPLDELDLFLGFKDDIIRPQLRHPEIADDPDALGAKRKETGEAIYTYFERLVADRRANPGDDLFSRFALGEVDGERMTDDQLLDIGFLFILGGLDTVTSTLDCAVAQLAQEPELRDRLVADPALIPAAIEELLRIHSPVMQVLRVVKQPHEMHGVKLETGDHVMVMIGGANSDDDEFGAGADDTDFDRTENRHLAFGGGAHRCLGSHLARFELRIALEELHRRIPDYALVGNPADLTYSPGIREIEHLPLAWPVP